MGQIEKKIGGHVYLYDHHWDRTKKKTIWKCLGRVDRPATLPDLSAEELVRFVGMLEWILKRPAGQGGYGYHDIAQLVLEKLRKG